MTTPDGQAVSFERLLQTVQAFSAKLRALDVKPGQTVVSFSENPATFYALTQAILRIGATVVCAASADRAVADGLFIDHAITLSDRPSRTTNNLVFDQSWFAASGHDSAGPDGKFIFSSSGTTGKSKYYLVPHSVLAARIQMRAQHASSTAFDMLITLPVWSGHGLFSALRANYFGGAVFWPKASARATLDSLDPENPLDISCTPAVLSDFLDAVGAGAKVPRVARIVLGGSAVDTGLAERAEKAFGCPVFNVYGSAETGANAYVRIVESRLLRGHAGRPLPGVSFAIEDDAGQPVAANIEGHVKVLAPEACRVGQVLIGDEPFYAKGRFNTGDLGYLTEDGELVLTGRVSELINSSGSKVAPERYEALALKHLNATQVAAFGMPNAQGSEDVGLAIVAPAAFDAVALKQTLEAAIGSHLKVHLFKVEALPINATGKIDRAELRRQLVA